ncbi:hypothetical protein JXB11_00845 [Candidatus Woesearchaeota archaeon]|nr:hypothetical protein [Candidatus Woesearchaeota archaeon]
MTESLALRREHMFALEDTVRDVAGRIIDYKGPVQDIKHVRGHEESSIDALAYEWMIGALEKNFGRFPDKERFRGKYLFELHELQDLEERGEEKEEEAGKRKTKVLRIDELDGTTNIKRSKASVLGYSPVAAVSVALCEDESMDSITIGVVYDLHNRSVFSGMRVDDGYMAFCDRNLLDPKDFIEKRGDTSTRIMVVGYSNTERIKKGQIEQAIVDADPTKKDFRLYDGSRTSAIDIINILRNQYDAYIDPRGLWEGSGAMLYPYDVAGVIPIALGCGLEISDIHGNTLEGYTGNDPLTVIVARAGMRDKFVEVLKPVVSEM